MIDFIVEHKRYFITAVIGLAIAIYSCFSRNIFAAEKIEDVYVILSDACLAPGIIFLALGIFLWASNEGLFNAIAYGMKILGRSFAPPKGEKIINEEFHEYNARVSQKKTKNSHFMIVGLVFMGLSIVFAALYMFI